MSIMENLDVRIGEQFVFSVVEARTHRQRRRGLSRIELTDDIEPMMFSRCRSIHTFGMKFDLDVVFLDKNNVVLGRRQVKPRRIVFGPRSTHSIVEIPIG
jgi:uncharacterized membrane protein (UPF0127 family)